MSFDFSVALDRAGHDAMAIDGLGTPGGFAPAPPKPGFDAIPMWVADMSFATAPAITQAIIDRARHPAFGYFAPRDAYFDAIIGWHERRNGVQGLTNPHIGYENGVLGGLVSALDAFTAPGDAVLLHSPTYIGFTASIERAGRTIVHSPLVRDADGVWRMDYDHMARVLAEHDIHLAVFCSPHNPCGRAWERWELERAAEVYAQARCVVVSDEIWSDLTLGDARHIPFQSVSDDARRRTIALYAPSKTFNLAGLIGSYHIVYDAYLRDRLVAQGTRTHYNDMNVLSMHALIGAYSDEGEAWLDELRNVLAANVSEACDYLDGIEGIEVARPQGTYMLFVDCTGWCEAHDMTIDDLEQAMWDVGVAVQDGRMFHGPCHIRMNLALPPARLAEALDRLDAHVFVSA